MISITLAFCLGLVCGVFLVTCLAVSQRNRDESKIREQQEVLRQKDEFISDLLIRAAQAARRDHEAGEEWKRGRSEE